MNSKTKGFIYGAIAAASYGMNPLFTLPLYAAGMSVDTVLFYRYFFAVIVLGILMKMQHQSFSLQIFCRWLLWDCYSRFLPYSFL